MGLATCACISNSVTCFLYPHINFTTIFPNSFLTMTSHHGDLTMALTVVLLALPMTAGEILQVRPTSTNRSCPVYSCHTLSEYTQDLGHYFKESNLTLHFLPGHHTLIENLTITSIHRLEILGNSNAVVPTKIICSPSVGVTFRKIFQGAYRWFGLCFVCQIS